MKKKLCDEDIKIQSCFRNNRKNCLRMSVGTGSEEATHNHSKTHTHTQMYQQQFSSADGPQNFPHRFKSDHLKEKLQNTRSTKTYTVSKNNYFTPFIFGPL